MYIKLAINNKTGNPYNFYIFLIIILFKYFKSIIYKSSKNFTPMGLSLDNYKKIMIFIVFTLTLMILLSFGFVGRELTYYYELSSKAAKELIANTYYGSINGIMAWNVFYLIFQPIAIYSMFNWSQKWNLAI